MYYIYVLQTWYSSAELLSAWEHLIEARQTLNSSAGYNHDLADLTRQVLQYKGDQIYPFIMEAFELKDLIAFE